MFNRFICNTKKEKIQEKNNLKPQLYGSNTNENILCYLLPARVVSMKFIRRTRGASFTWGAHVGLLVRRGVGKNFFEVDQLGLIRKQNSDFLQNSPSFGTGRQ